MRLARQVVKSLAHRPWYAASIIVVMAIGCALLTSVLAIVDGVLFKPLGYPGERELVAISLSTRESRYAPNVSQEDLTAWAESSPGILFTGFRTHSRSIADVQPNFFDVIGIRPALGGFVAQDFEGPAPRTGPRIITDEIFRSQFGGDPAAIGRVVILDPSTGSGYRVAGVMPAGFKFPADRWAVTYLAPYIEAQGAPGLQYSLTQVIARTPAGAGEGDLVSRVLAAAKARNPARGPVTNTGNQPVDAIDVEPLSRALGARSRPLFMALLVAAALLVAIAALNASTLMAARSVDRGRELAVRRTLGATPLDIGKLLLVEAGLMVCAGAVIGLAIATPLLRLAAALLPEDVVLFRTATIDWRIVVFNVAASLVLAGIVAIWSLRLVRLGGTSPGHGRSVTGQTRSLSWRLVVTAQVALALVLTVGGSLLVGSLLSVYARTPPIETEKVLTVAVQFLGMPSTVGRETPERATRVEALLDTVRTVTGVDGVALTAYDILEHAYQPSSFVPPTTALKPPRAMVTHAVTADFYRVVQPQLVSGRLPSAEELANNHPVIVVSEAVANRFWPSAAAVGQTLIDKGRRDATAMAFTVVGVVKDVRWAAWDERESPTIYGPYALLARQTNSAVLIGASAGLSRIEKDVLRVMTEADPFVRAGRVATLDHLFVDSVRRRRFQAWLFGSFAFASLFVVGLGIFGQLAMSTARRTREVGIRLTCGATPAGIARLILREQLVPVVAGLAAGGLAAAWAVQFVRSYLYQVTSSDARVWAAAIGLILLTAAAGTLIPALRTSRIDPTKALRAD